jgi:hypothetical protein
VKLSTQQIRVLQMIARDGDAGELYYEIRGPNPAFRQAAADRTLTSLAKRGLVTDGDCWSITDAGRKALEVQP